MPYPRFEGLVPGGKEIDLFITHHKWAKAVELLMAAERDLTVRRRLRGSRLRKFPNSGKQHGIDSIQIGILNKRLSLICATLRGKNALLKKANKPRIKRVRKPARRLRP